MANPLLPDGNPPPDPNLYRVQKPLARMILLMLQEDLAKQVEDWKKALDAGHGDANVPDPVISDSMRQAFAALGYTTGLRDPRIVKLARPSSRPRGARTPAQTLGEIRGEIAPNESLDLPDPRR